MSMITGKGFHGAPLASSVLRNEWRGFGSNQTSVVSHAPRRAQPIPRRNRQVMYKVPGKEVVLVLFPQLIAARMRVASKFR